jgi:hypothetical protein
MTLKPTDNVRHGYNEKNFCSVSTATSTTVSGVNKDSDNKDASSVTTPLLAVKNLAKLATDLRSNSISSLPSSPTNQYIQHASSNDSCCST